MACAERFGYWAIQWSTDWSPSLTGLFELVPELVLGKRVAITSCDSGSYSPSEDELRDGWRVVRTIALSREITLTAELPEAGFDEWYIFDSVPKIVPILNHVNQFDFSVLDESDANESFWEQVSKTQPLHVLGAGASNRFFVTRDRMSFECVKKLNV